MKRSGLCRRHAICTNQFHNCRERARGGAKAARNQSAVRKGRTKIQAAVRAGAWRSSKRTRERSRCAIQRILRALELPRAVYYAWRKRATTDGLADKPLQATRMAE